MKIRTDRVYALVNNASGKFPHLAIPHIYSRLLAAGHERPVRKHSDTPIWESRESTCPLRLLKNAYGLGDMFQAFRFVCSSRCLQELKTVCPHLRHQQAFIESTFYVEYECDGTVHVPKEDQFPEPQSPGDPTVRPDEWVNRLAVKYRSPTPKIEWYEIIPASGSKTCVSYPVVREISSSEYGGVSKIEFRPQAVEDYGWVAMGPTCISPTVMQVIDKYLPRPYTVALPITLDGCPCIEEAW